MHDIATLLGPTRTASIAALAREVSPRSIGRWLETGRLVRLHPGWVTLPEWADDWSVRANAATSYAGGPLSHISALSVHGLVDDRGRQLHVLTPSHHRVRTTPWLRVHRSRLASGVVIARGLPATPLPRALIDTWADAHRRRRGFASVARGAVLRATRERRVGTEELARELARRPELAGRTALVELLGLIAGGCQSELEIFGVRHVLDIPGLPPCRQQHEVRLSDRSVFLDAAWPEVKVAVELDGAAFHGSQEARERDLRRDAALTALGWVVLRFSYRRLTRDPEGCRAEILATYRRRRLTADRIS
ncbi:DUF559 domain-containing protein [Blastococcus litoris]|uniref:DUF559 domain-containing protein n=1 Tax=Blastococcus litoris TaxID=2171622 RepID=UPI0013E019B2|nr:DUF559 domain-containing protein [Blastococcus litoris]